MTIINLKVGYFVEKKKGQYTLKYRYTGKSRDGKPRGWNHRQPFLLIGVKK